MIVIAKGSEEPTEENYWLEPGQPYFVYAITQPKTSPQKTTYAINISEGATVYDVPAELFKVVDDSLPGNWKEAEYDAYGVLMTIKTFPEWAHDSSFFSKLWDDDPQTVEIFKKYAEEYQELAQRYK
ncbi:MAG TPA: hypothetical protein VJ843_06145 [Candidatus Saccharimonadales bacterium]|nr:hypothetical protein [Candidatus Saccharimonadales bacterium]